MYIDYLFVVFVRSMLDIAHRRECFEDGKREICVFILSLVVFVTFSLGLGSAILLWKLIKSPNVPYRLMEHRHFMFFGTLIPMKNRPVS